MVILTSCGLKIKEKCGDLLKLVRNKKVLICSNGLNLSSKKDTLNTISLNIQDLVVRLDEDELNVDNVYKYIDYYDCIYIAGGNIKLLSEMLNHKEIYQSIHNFIKKGKILITEGMATLITTHNLDYIDHIIANFDEEDNIYKKLNYSLIKTLNLTKEKIIVHSNCLSKFFKGSCKFVEKQNRLTFTYLKDGDIIVL